MISDERVAAIGRNLKTAIFRFTGEYVGVAKDVREICSELLSLRAKMGTSAQTGHQTPDIHDTVLSDAVEKSQAETGRES